jgi:hypothetical protein
MSFRSALKLPKEHGAWAMLYAPFVLGVAVAGRVNWQILLLLFSATAAFISRESLLVYWRARARGREAPEAGSALLLYLALAAAFGSTLVFAFKLFWLIPLGVIGAALLLINGKQATRMEERSMMGEILAIGGLTMTAPAAYYAASGRWEMVGFWLWLLSALYMASSVFYIKLRVYRLNPRKQAEQRQALRSCAFYHSFLVIALPALIFAAGLSLLAFIAFAPAIIRTFWGMFMPKSKVDLTRAGILEIVYSVIFMVCAALGFRLA